MDSKKEKEPQYVGIDIEKDRFNAVIMQSSSNSYRSYRGSVSSLVQRRRFEQRVQPIDHVIINQSIMAAEMKEMIRDIFIPSIQLWEAWRVALGGLSTKLCLFACRYYKIQGGQAELSAAMEQQILMHGAETLHRVQNVGDSLLDQMEDPQVDRAEDLAWEERILSGENLDDEPDKVEEVLLRFQQVKEMYEKFSSV